MNAIPTAARPTILLDVDEVLAEWVQGLVARFQERHPELPCTPAAERADYNTLAYHRTPEERSAVLRILREPGFFASLEPVPGSRRAVREMRKAGFHVEVCTKPMLSNPTCASEKLEWVRRVHGQTVSSRATITMDKTMQIGDVLIDDHPNITGHNPNPVWTQLRLTRPHNVGLPGHRFQDWGQWESAVGEVLAAREEASETRWGVRYDTTTGWYDTRERAERELDAHQAVSHAPAALVQRIPERTIVIPTSRKLVIA